MKSLFLLVFPLFFCVSFEVNAQQEESIPTHDTFTLTSKQLGETRTINAWKPTAYGDTTQKLPVLYMLDGGVKEDFPHVASTLMELINKNIIPPIILVGIENTQRRRDLTGFTNVEEDKKIASIVGGSIPFRAFIKEELFPAVEQKYRVNEKKSILGESLAGLFIVETLLTEPNMFDNYIAFDPSLWWNNDELVKQAKSKLANFPAAPKQFWFAGSNTKGIYAQTKKLESILKSINLSSLKWNYTDARKEKHDTIFKATKVKALTWAFGHN
ncbi:MAG: alpha/beta hydrolase [Pedobacter sp.]|nr:MAG: alpha/beta hydrolase [Pedobacter sp.]